MRSPAAGTPGIQWKDVQFAFGGGAELDTPNVIIITSALSPAIPFIGVYNGCATGSHRPQPDRSHHPVRPAPRSGSPVAGMGQAPTGRAHRQPGRAARRPLLVRRLGYFLTTKFFGMKINRYVPTTASPRDLGYGGGEELPRRGPERDTFSAASRCRWRRSSAPGCSTTRSPSTCTRTRPGAPWCCAAPTSPTSTPRRRSTCGPPLSGPAVQRPRGARHLGHDRPGRLADGLRLPGRLQRPDQAPGGRRRRPASRPTPAPRSIHMGRGTGCAPTASRNSCSPTGPPRSTARCRSTPTAA